MQKINIPIDKNKIATRERILGSIQLGIRPHEAEVVDIWFKSLPFLPIGLKTHSSEINVDYLSTLEFKV